MKGAKIVGTGISIPSKVLTNLELEKMVDTSNEWIMGRTGISERRIASGDETTSTFAVEALKKALKNANVSVEELEMILVATATGDMPFPATACLVQQKLNAPKLAAFDITAACCGFLYGLSIAKQYIATSEYKTVAVIGAETLSKITDWKDRNTCVLLGDGAGAVVIKSCELSEGILGNHLWADGNFSSLLQVPAGGSRMPASHETVDNRLHYLKMNGTEVFKQAVRVMTEGVEEVLKKAGLTAADIDLFIPHQANLRIIKAMADRMDLPSEKVFVNIHKYGNTSAASIAIALDESVREGRLKKGDIVAMASFGSGLTMASCVMRWEI